MFTYKGWKCYGSKNRGWRGEFQDYILYSSTRTVLKERITDFMDNPESRSWYLTGNRGRILYR